MAAVAEVGKPSVNSGTSTPAADALLAASGPATPSIAPLPNSSLCCESFFSSVYDNIVGISDPPPGMVPIGKPMAVPRSQGFQERRQSSRVMKALPLRSEEHTSELQSLMRTSYAVFCLNKKK